MAFQQWRDHRFGLAGGRRRDDQCVVPGEDGWNCLLLNGRKAAVACEEGRPGVEELILLSERFHGVCQLLRVAEPGFKFSDAHSIGNDRKVAAAILCHQHVTRGKSDSA